MPSSLPYTPGRRSENRTPGWTGHSLVGCVAAVEVLRVHQRPVLADFRRRRSSRRVFNRPWGALPTGGRYRPTITLRGRSNQSGLFSFIASFHEARPDGAGQVRGVAVMAESSAPDRSRPTGRSERSRTTRRMSTRVVVVVYRSGLVASPGP